MAAYPMQEMPSNQPLSSDDLTNFLEEVCSIFLRILSEGNRDKFNYVTMNLQEIVEEAHDTFVEIHGKSEVIH